MPLAAPIGSGLGIQNPYNIAFIKDAVSVPVIVDAGLGCASDVSIAMELGADAILANTAIAQAKDPMLMAQAFKYAVIAGRMGYKAGRISKKPYATASSPIDGLIQF
jgi:thiazole synthase